MLVFSSNKRYKYLLLVPVAGAILFLIFYCLAAFNYPGGSQAAKYSKGFSWQNNYWCNLLNEVAINGQPNGGRSYAMIGMLVLCFSLGSFWYYFSLCIPLKRYYRLSMQVSGTSSMCIAFFIFSGFHDVIINIAGLLAMVALTVTFIGLYKMKWKNLFVFGLLNLLLVVVNNWLYYGGGLRYLPVVQKITFLSFLLWICLVTIKMYRYTKNNPIP